jgi:hypothetical protein
MGAGSKWAISGKQNWRCGINQPEKQGAPGKGRADTAKASAHPDSRTVATEVGTRQEVCNNLPTECTGLENGWR